MDYYYDIHTHQPPVHPEDKALLNTIVREESDTPVRTSVPRSYGIHPWYISNAEEQLAALRRLIARPDAVAIGEAGLDKLADSSMETQREVFIAQARLAEETGKPLIIHCVKAWPELVACLKEIRPERPWIIHGFRGNGELAAQLIRLGCLLSLGKRFQPSAALAAWPDHLFAETDDEPLDIRRIYQGIAASLRLPETEVVERIARNVARLTQ